MGFIHDHEIGRRRDLAFLTWWCIGFDPLIDAPGTPGRVFRRHNFRELLSSMALFQIDWDLFR